MLYLPTGYGIILRNIQEDFVLKKNDLKKNLRLFDLRREGKGMSKNEKLNESGFKRFFLTFKNNFGKLVAHAPYTLNPCSAEKRCSRV